MSFNEYTSDKASQLVSIKVEEQDTGKKYFIERKTFSPTTGKEVGVERESLKKEVLLAHKQDLLEEIAGIDQVIEDIEELERK